MKCIPLSFFTAAAAKELVRKAEQVWEVRHRPARRTSTRALAAGGDASMAIAGERGGQTGAPHSAWLQSGAGVFRTRAMCAAFGSGAATNLPNIIIRVARNSEYRNAKVHDKRPTLDAKSGIENS